MFLFELGSAGAPTSRFGAMLFQGCGSYLARLNPALRLASKIGEGLVRMVMWGRLIKHLSGVLITVILGSCHAAAELLFGSFGTMLSSAVHSTETKVLAVPRIQSFPTIHTTGETYLCCRLSF